MNTETTYEATTDSVWISPPEIDLEKTTFHFRGNKVSGDALARLLGLVESGNQRLDNGRDELQGQHVASALRATLIPD